MTQPNDCAPAFQPTETGVSRHLEFVDEMVEAIWGMWTESGDVAAQPQRAERMIEAVRNEWLVVGRAQWMHPLDSIGVKTGAVDIPAPGKDRLDYFDALRTSVGIGSHERAKWAAEAMGLTVAQVKRYDAAPKKPRVPLREGRTALYRHYDANDVLLYVGISNDPDQRFILHAYTARWYDCSARCDVEWHTDRPAALSAERDAIRSERPLFNLSGSIVDPDDAEEYLLGRELDRIAEMLA